MELVQALKNLVYGQSFLSTVEILDHILDKLQNFKYGAMSVNIGK